MKSKHHVRLLSIVLLLFCSFLGQATSKTIIKIAIIDNFHFQPYITNDFGKNYLSGISLANHQIQKDGYEIQYKVFNYARKNPLAVFSCIDPVKKWHPDVILGPRNSNIFLLLKNSFHNILVLSPFATSDKVKELPSNYYSLMFPDEYLAKVMTHYLGQHFPKKEIFSIEEADCKNCMDLANDFSKEWTQNHKPIIRKQYVSTHINDIAIDEIMAGYKKGDIILLPNTAYASAILMAKITNYLGYSVVFVGGDDWGSWENTEIGKIKAENEYSGIHFTSSSIDIDAPFIKQFKTNFYQFYNKYPSENASLLGYTAIFSIVDALKKYPSNSQTTLKKQILNAYLSARKDQPNWYRSLKYAVYEVNYLGAKYLGAINI